MYYNRYRKRKKKEMMNGKKKKNKMGKCRLEDHLRVDKAHFIPMQAHASLLYSIVDCQSNHHSVVAFWKLLLGFGVVVLGIPSIMQCSHPCRQLCCETGSAKTHTACSSRPHHAQECNCYCKPPLSSLFPQSQDSRQPWLAWWYVWFHGP